MLIAPACTRGVLGTPWHVNALERSKPCTGGCTVDTAGCNLAENNIIYRRRISADHPSHLVAPAYHAGLRPIYTFALPAYLRTKEASSLIYLTAVSYRLMRCSLCAGTVSSRVSTAAFVRRLQHESPPRKVVRRDLRMWPHLRHKLTVEMSPGHCGTFLAPCAAL